MKCNSCGTEIPPEWVAAIKSNVCPACGGSVMSDIAKELLDNLADALQRMPNNPEGIAGWLMSNYELRKIGTGEPVSEFYGKKKPDKNEKVTMSDAKRESFYKNAGAKSPAEYAKLAMKIRESEEAYANGDTLEVEESGEELDDDERAAVAVMSPQVLMPRYIKTQASEPSVETLMEGTESLHPRLQQDRLKRLEKQQSVANGGVDLKRGGFVRGS